MKPIVLLLTFIFASSPFVDSRDNTTYTTHVVQNKSWIKENLRYLFKQKAITDSISLEIPGYYSSYGAYYSFTSAKNACPIGYHLPNFNEWKKLLDAMPGKTNARNGILLPTTQLENYGLQLGGMSAKDTVFMAGTMGYYWTASDTIKTPSNKNKQRQQRHLIGIHIWSRGEKDSIHVEPAYLLANHYESKIALNCKCIQD